jgi:hypothetical protein
VSILTSLFVLGILVYVLFHLNIILRSVYPRRGKRRGRCAKADRCLYDVCYSDCPEREEL